MFSVYRTRGIGDTTVYELVCKIICEMVIAKMHIAGGYCIMISTINVLFCIGFTTDGEWNSLRTKEYSSPLPVFQICADARSKFSCKCLKSMLAMITTVYLNVCVC